VNVFVSDEQDEPLDAAGLRHMAEVVLAAEGLPETTEVAVLLVSADQIAEYNARFMDRDGPTDVLAFPLEDLQPGRYPTPGPGEPPLGIGDVFLCPSEIKRRAPAMGVVFEDFLYLLAVHGILHLLGYEHDDEESATRMERREEELLAMVGRAL